MRQELLGLVRENYPRVSSELLRPLVELISLSRQYCDGDIDKFLILMVVALRTTEHPQFVALDPHALDAGSAGALPGLGTNARSIAASLEMPKETVRRKVAELVEAGWLAREGYSLYYTAHAYRRLAPVRQQLTALAVRYFEVVQTIAGRPQTERPSADGEKARAVTAWKPPGRKSRSNDEGEASVTGPLLWLLLAAAFAMMAACAIGLCADRRQDGDERH